MLKIECPRTGVSAEKCNWVERKGQVRDAPGIGVIKCEECLLVTHSSDLSGRVNYESGSMHKWTVGYGDANLAKPTADIERRRQAILALQETDEIKTVLDFGCGSGEMLRAMDGQFRTFGIEPDKSAREQSQGVCEMIWESAESALASGRNFDLVSLFHVIEHLYDPYEELQRIKSLLRPGGLIVIETPNSNDALLTKYDSDAFQNFTYWSHHPMLHSHDSLATLVLKNGFTVIENRGVQRYDLANHLYWLSKGEPGGHDVWSDLVSEKTSKEYAKDLARSEISDTLWLVARNKFN